MRIESVGDGGVAASIARATLREGAGRRPALQSAG
jgi:hypothetical protein